MAIWKKLFSKITFKNYPDTSTPINANNLNKMTDAIDGIDNRVVELNSNLKWKQIASSSNDSLASYDISSYEEIKFIVIYQATSSTAQFTQEISIPVGILSSSKTLRTGFYSSTTDNAMVQITASTAGAKISSLKYVGENILTSNSVTLYVYAR